ncbi:GAD-like domain-containing protein [Nocardia salmonicida]|uniref:GAD-like domain-containing protein n=1 Tax=Nocardia salmonicida TaxID=53431 RepID=UPI0037883204
MPSASSGRCAQSIDAAVQTLGAAGMEIEPLKDMGVDQAVSRLGTPYSTVAAEDRLVDRYAGRVPDLLLDIWRAVGFSGYADGLLWLCNPEDWKPAVDEWI